MMRNIELLNSLGSADLLNLKNVFDESKKYIEISYSSFADLEETLNFKSLVVLRQDKRIIGFLSFYHNYSVPNYLIIGKEEWSPSNFVHLVCIESKFRNQETYKAFYDYLFYQLPDGLKCSLVTTLSYINMDSDHIDALVHLGFKTIARDEDGGGRGVDHIYFGLRV